MTARLSMVALQVCALAAREHVPVDVSQVIARSVRAVLGKLLTEAEVRGAVQTGHEAIDHRARDELEARDRREHGGVEQALHQLPAGAGTCAMS